MSKLSVNNNYNLVILRCKFFDVIKKNDDELKLHKLEHLAHTSDYITLLIFDILNVKGMICAFRLPFKENIMWNRPLLTISSNWYDLLFTYDGFIRVNENRESYDLHREI